MLQYPVRFQTWGRPDWGGRQNQGSREPFLPGNPRRVVPRGILDQRVTEWQWGQRGWRGRW